MNGTRSDTAGAAITTTVSALSDDRLIARTKELSGIEHHLEVVVIDHLREIQKRRLYLRRGFSSLFDYAVRELGYSDAAAWRRLKAMRLCADIYGVRERLQDGSMTLNAAAQLQNAFDRQERNRDRAARSAPGGTGFGAAARSQDGEAPTPGPAQPAERKPAPVLDRSARRALVEQAAGKSSRQVMRLLAEVDPELAAPADRVRPLGAGRWELKAVIDDECRHGLERLQGLLSHVDPHMTMGQLMARLVREGLDRHDPARPPRGRTGGRAAGAEQTSAAKTQASSARGAASAAKQEAGSDSVAPSAAKPAGDTTSAPKPAAPPRPQTSAAEAIGRTGRAISAAVNARSGSATGAVAATLTAPPGAAAAPNTCCRSITSYRMPKAAPPSRTISDCCAPLITATATPAPDSAATPARTVNLRSRRWMPPSLPPGSISGVTGDPAGSISAPSWHYRPRFPKHWQRRSLLSLAHWVNGLAFRDIQFSPRAAGGKPVIKIAEIKAGISAQTKFTTQTFDDAVRVRAGDLLFSWSGQPETSIDAYRWRGPEGWLNQHVFRVTPVDVDTAFFHYLLRYLNPHFVAIAKNKQTTGLGHVTRRDLENMRVAVPPPSEQRAIGHVLGSLDDKIELNRRMNETLEAMARALFTSWFVDFEPVRAKMAGRDTGLQAPIDDLFPERIVGIGNRQVPEGWRHGTVHDVSSLNPESWSAKRRPTELSYVDLANTKWGYIESADLPWEKAPSRARRVLRKRDTIMATVRPGNGAFALVDEDGLTGSTGFAVLRPREAADRALVWCAVTSAANLARLSLLADGSAYPAVRPAVVAATPVALADFAIRAEFSSMVDPLLDKIEANKREIPHLRGLRDQILPRFFTDRL